MTPQQLVNEPAKDTTGHKHKSAFCALMTWKQPQDESTLNSGNASFIVRESRDQISSPHQSRETET